MDTLLSKMTSFVTVLVFFSITFAEARELQPASVFGNNMVLQRNKEIKIWGTAGPGTSVSIDFARKKTSATVRPDGYWEILLPAEKECPVPQRMTIESGNEKIIFDNILIGDVWLASGQSNMLMRVNSLAKEDKNDATAKKDFGLRYAQISPIVEGGKIKAKSKPEWAALGDGDTGRWSAFALYFAEQLRASAGIPIGIICCAQGSSNIEAWIGKDFIRENSLTLYCQEDYPEGKIFSHYKNVSSLYDSMLSQVTGYTLKGVIWYQGEANAKSGIAGNYGTLLNGLVECWRKIWNDPELPFGIVQLPNYGYKETSDYRGQSWAELREEQKRVCEKTGNCVLAVTADIGDEKNIHPKNKKEAGKRMAFSILDEIYEIKGCPKFPKLKKAKFRKDNITLYFNGDKLQEAYALNGFEIQDDSGNWFSAEAWSHNSKVIVRTAGKKVTALRYAWKNNPEISVYGKSGLPASPMIIN